MACSASKSLMGRAFLAFRVLAAGVVVSFAVGAAGVAHAGGRVALLIDSSAQNSKANHEVMERLKGQLAGFGFQVIWARGPQHEALKERVRAFRSKLDEQPEFAVLAYVGRSVRHQDRNFIVATDWTAAAGYDSAAGAFEIEQLIDDMAGKSEQSLVFVDSFLPATQQSRPVGATLGFDGRRLGSASAKMQVAYDVSEVGGDGEPRALMMEALQRQLARKRVQLAALVRDDVQYDTGWARMPRVYGSLQLDETFFSPGEEGGAQVCAPLKPDGTLVNPAGTSQVLGWGETWNLFGLCGPSPERNVRRAPKVDDEVALPPKSKGSKPKVQEPEERPVVSKRAPSRVVEEARSRPEPKPEPKVAPKVVQREDSAPAPRKGGGGAYSGGIAPGGL